MTILLYVKTSFITNFIRTLFLSVSWTRRRIMTISVIRYCSFHRIYFWLRDFFKENLYFQKVLHYARNTRINLAEIIQLLYLGIVLNIFNISGPVYFLSNVYDYQVVEVVGRTSYLTSAFFLPSCVLFVFFLRNGTRLGNQSTRA